MFLRSDVLCNQVRFLPGVAVSFILMSLVSSAAFSSSISHIVTKANLGDKRAQYELGLAYMTGQELSYNPKKAIRWFKKSAAQNYYKAWYRLGEMNFDKVFGIGNYRAAYKWYFKPAKKGHGVSQYKLALLYYRGKGTARNYSKALIWAARAKKNGIPTAAALISRINAGLMKSVLKSPENRAPSRKNQQAGIVRSAAKVSDPSNVPEMLFHGLWKMNGRASDYLPSKSTKCITIRNKMRCTSRSRKVTLEGGYIANFQIVSLIESFRPQAKFAIRYRNKYLSIKKTIANSSGSESENIPKLGMGDKIFRLSCKALSRKVIRCLKEDNSAIQFTRNM